MKAQHTHLWYLYLVGLSRDERVFSIGRRFGGDLVVEPLDFIVFKRCRMVLGAEPLDFTILKRFRAGLAVEPL